MKFSFSWIREFVAVDGSAAELARRLTAAGLPVETAAFAADGDAVLEFEIFANRPDCMNVYGIAREAAAATGRALCPYPSDVMEDGSSPRADSLARVTIENPDLCGRYCARVMRGVTIGDSPDWLARRLTAIGLRPVNNVVDATNYVLWEFGHPIHAFDYDTLEGREIRVRRARRGESIVTLDGAQRALDPEMLGIADAKRPVAVAGVMGGRATMVTGSTSALLIESAHFAPVSVRRTSKKLSLSTDASYRFERGADIEAAAVAVNRAADLIRQVSGGIVCSGIVESRPSPPATRRIHLRCARAAALLGVPVEPPTISRALAALQIPAHPSGDGFEVEVPSHRQDLEREVDLIEEVARSIGYDAIPERLPCIPGTGGINRAGHRRESAVRTALAAAACSEAVLPSFVSSAVDWGLRERPDPEKGAIEPVALANPIAADQEILRTTILPGLLAVVAHNVNRGSKDVRLFEIGHVFRRGAAAPTRHENRKHPPIGPVEETVSIGIALTGAARPRHWVETPRDMTLYDLKGIIEAICTEVALPCTFEPRAGCDAFEQGQSAVVSSGGAWIGRLGALTPGWRERLDLRQETFVAELSLTAMASLPRRRTTYRSLPRFPAVSRDLSLIVRAGQTYADLQEAIRGVAPDLIACVSVFDLYRGDALPAGCTGLSVNIVYQHPDRTLASEEVTKLQEKILQRLAEDFGVKLRV